MTFTDYTGRRVTTEAAGEDWKTFGSCRETDPDLFFPGEHESVVPAKQVCGGCPVRRPCLAYVLSYPEPMTGVWGGTSENERRRIRRGRGLAEAS